MIRLTRLFVCLILSVFLHIIFILPASAESGWIIVPDIIHPGQNSRFSFTCPPANVTVSVLQSNGIAVAQPFSGESNDTETVFFWDGLGLFGIPEAGDYTIRLFTSEGNFDAPLKIGSEVPCILSLDADEVVSSNWTTSVETNMPGNLLISVTTNGEPLTIFDGHVNKGLNEISWDGLINGTYLPAGEWDISFRLINDSGESSITQVLNLIQQQTKEPSVATDATPYHSPDDLSGVRCDHESCYWKLNQGEMDEEAIWSVLTEPVYVLKGKQRDRIKVREQPSKNCKTYVGEVTCTSQAVHILDQQDGWTLIEAFSSSSEDSRVKVYATQFTGWVETKLLEEKKVSSTYGIVIDKLQQRMYIFKEGHLWSTLLCSTGYSTNETPWNETPAGEYLIVSWTGGFWSSNLFCDMALRINSGILIHEVPCVITYNDDKTEAKRDYWRCERYLGEKASHGCIRTQRVSTPEGVSMKWLWDHLERDTPTKVLIWDEIYRELGYPDDDYLLYYNENGGKYYHSSPNCMQVNSEYWPLSPFKYGDLDHGDFAKLEKCPGCAPQLRHSEIDILNSKNDRLNWME